jgi:hypothetical protein
MRHNRRSLNGPVAMLGSCPQARLRACRVSSDCDASHTGQSHYAGATCGTADRLGQIEGARRRCKSRDENTDLTRRDVRCGSRTTDFRCPADVRFSRKRKYRQTAPSDEKGNERILHRYLTPSKSDSCLSMPLFRVVRFAKKVRNCEVWQPRTATHGYAYFDAIVYCRRLRNRV